MQRTKVIVFTSLALLAGLGGGALMMPHLISREDEFQKMNMEAKVKDFSSERQAIFAEMVAQGQYACCLEHPCAYCIEKTPGHGVGAACQCLADVVEGRHPCGECMGEILEGHGNKYLAKYFATALADELGIQHKDELMQIISEKYSISVADQI